MERFAPLRSRLCSAFTLVELLVVISIIILVLGIGIPGLTRMLEETRANAGIQSVGSFLTRAYSTAEAQSNWTAVRVTPGAWDYSPLSEPGQPSNRQHLVLYERRADRRNPGNGQLVAPGDLGQPSQFTEFFARVPGVESLILPDDVWLAPGELLTTGVAGNRFRDLFATGQHGTPAFEIDPRAGTPDGMANMDDFLIIFEPGRGLRTTRVPPISLTGSEGHTDRHMLLGYIPPEFDGVLPPGTQPGGQALGSWQANNPLRIGGFHRFAFSSLAFYSRAGLLNEEQSNRTAPVEQVRQNWLRANARAFAVPSHGGGLLEGPSGTQ